MIHIDSPLKLYNNIIKIKEFIYNTLNEQRNVFLETESIFVDEKLSREDFFKKIKIFFLYVAENISSGNQLLHWELIMNKCPKFISTNFTIDESLMNGTEYSITNKSSNEKLVSENNAALELKPSLIAETSRDSENR